MNFKLILCSIVLLFILSCGSTRQNEEHTGHRRHGEMCRSRSREWVLQHARFPDSYQAVGFSSIEESAVVEPQEWGFFSTARTIPGSERFTIIHQYMLADSNQQSIRLYSRFVFDSEFNVEQFVFSTSELGFSDTGLPGEAQWRQAFGKP